MVVKPFGPLKNLFIIRSKYAALAGNGYFSGIETKNADIPKGTQLHLQGARYKEL